MSAIWAVARKDIKLLLRDKGGLFFTVFFPVGYAIFFGAIMGGGGGPGDADHRIEVAVVDEDRTESSKAFVKTLTDGTEFAVKPVETLEQAEQMVRTKDAAAYIRLEKGFGVGQENMFFGGASGAGKSKIEVGADPSRKAEMGMLQGVLQKYAFQGLGRSFTDPTIGRKQIASARRQVEGSEGLSPASKLLLGMFFNDIDKFYNGLDTVQKEPAKPGEGKAGGGFEFSPVEISTHDVVGKRRQKGDLPTNAFAISFPQGMIWGVMGAALGFAASFVTERNSGTYARLRVSPMPPLSLILGKGVACFLVACFMIGLMVAVAGGLGVDLSNWKILAVAALAVAYGFVGIMMLIASLSRTERQAAGMGWAVMLIMAFVGGAAIPSFAMPGWMQRASFISPIRWALYGLEGGVWREFTMQEMIGPVAVMVGMGTFGLVVGSMLLKRNRG